MFKIKYLFSILIFLSVSVKSQNAEPFTGKWKFKNIYHSEKIGSEELKMLRLVFKDVTMYFKPNKHYKAFLLKNEEGNWSYNDTSRMITLAANKGTQSIMQILDFSADTLVLSIDKDKAFILQRTKIDPADDIEEPISNIAVVNATISQISKKWYLLKRVVPGRTEEQSKLATELVGETYFHFKDDNTYESQTLKIKSQGSWSFVARNSTLLTTIENTTLTWKIKAVNEHQLILMRGNTEETWTFSTKPN